MSQFSIVFICLMAGFALRRLPRGGGDHIGHALNTVVIYVALPALTIIQIHKMSFTGTLFLAAAMPWVNFVCAALWSAGLGWLLKWPRQLTGMMALTTGLGNTSFLGFPLIEAILGKEGLPTAIVSDQLGSFAVVSTLGIFLASYYGSDSKTSMSAIIRRVATFPPFIATIVAITTRGLELPEDLVTPLERIGSTLTPLALISVGTRIEFDIEIMRRYWKNLTIGLTLKMAAAPALALLLTRLLSGQEDISHKVIVLEAAMPSMITGYLIGAEHRLDGKFGALMVTVGIVLAIFTVPLWAL
jgi:malate permease and related proteins